MAKTKKKDSSVKEMLSRGILHLLKSSPDKVFNYKQISAALLVKDENTRKLINEILKELHDSKLIESKERGKFRFKAQNQSLTGTVDITKSGNGYLVISEEIKDLFISSENMKNALHGDTVTAKLIFGKKARKQKEAKVVEVIKRARTTFAGIVDLQSNHGFVVPDNSKIHVDFFIPKSHMNDATHGQKVLVEFMHWEKGDKNPTAKITKILGNPGENDAEIHAILAEYDLPYEFPEAVEKYAHSLDRTITEEEIGKRRDLRNKTTFTIDPYDAKDFDDALSVEFLEDDRYEIGVHIADVSHYLIPGSILDKEALNRATSIYLVDRVVPMLPETLSNELCSLRPNEEKLCFSAVFELDKHGNVQKQWFGRTIINSDRRFTYEEAQEIIEGKEGDFKEEILLLDSLAKKLRKRRIEHGAIEFGSDEVKFRLDDKGKPVEVFKKVMKDSNKLIEEFMLLANKHVAELFGKPSPPKPFVYRVHDLPDEDKMKVLKDYLKNFGYRLEHTEGKSAAYALNRVLQQIEGKPEEGIIKQIAVRAMAKAVYTTENLGHYGLAFEHYSHFTSPIRRYPDVMVHRLLQKLLDKQHETDVKKLELQARHSSSMERKAVEAERASIKYMQVQFLADKVGEEFDGIISGLSSWGIYVEVIENKCEGMISLNSLKDDYYNFDDRKYKIAGERYGKEFHLGDAVKIRVKSADILKKQLDFELVDQDEF